MSPNQTRRNWALDYYSSSAKCKHIWGLRSGFGFFGDWLWSFLARNCYYTARRHMTEKRIFFFFALRGGFPSGYCFCCCMSGIIIIGTNGWRHGMEGNQRTDSWSMSFFDAVQNKDRFQLPTPFNVGTWNRNIQLGCLFSVIHHVHTLVWGMNRKLIDISWIQASAETLLKTFNREYRVYRYN